MGQELIGTDVAPPYVVEPLGADGVARIRYTVAVVLTEAVARRAMADLGTLTNGQRPPLLADIRNVKSVTREARKYLDNASWFSALALLAGSPATQLMVNFFLGMGRPKVPTLMFTDEEKALAWLRRHVV